MIIGIGNDITDIRRIEKTLKRFGKRFEERIFTERERKKAASRSKAGAKTVAATYAKRFAAKEACAKALGTGLRGISWQDMEVTNLASGAPTMSLHGKAQKRLEAIAPAGAKVKIFLSMSDEYPMAMAQVIIAVGP